MSSGCQIKKKYDVINGWKGILALIIFSEHFGIMGFNPDTGYLAVGCFFIISGFLLALSIEKYDIKSINPFKITWKRMKAVYPCYLYGMFLMFLYYFIFPYIKPNGRTVDVSINSFIGEILMLQKSGFFNSTAINGADWYISAYIISTFIIIVLIKLLRKKVLYFIPGIIIVYIYVSYMFLYGNYDAGYVYTGHIYMYVYKIDGQLVKGIACMFIGMLAYYLTMYVNKKFSTLKFINCLELIVTFIFLNLFFTDYKNHENIWILVLISIILLLSVREEGIVSKILKMKPFQFLGNLSMYLYLTHLFAGFFFLSYIEKHIKYKSIVDFDLIIFVLIFAYVSKKILEYCLKFKSNIKSVGIL